MWLQSRTARKVAGHDMIGNTTTHLNLYRDSSGLLAVDLVTVGYRWLPNGVAGRSVAVGRSGVVGQLPSVGRRSRAHALIGAGSCSISRRRRHVAVGTCPYRRSRGEFCGRRRGRWTGGCGSTSCGWISARLAPNRRMLVAMVHRARTRAGRLAVRLGRRPATRATIERPRGVCDSFRGVTSSEDVAECYSKIAHRVCRPVSLGLFVRHFVVRASTCRWTDHQRRRKTRS